MVRGLSLTAVLWILSTPFVNIATATTADATAPIVDLGYARYQGYFDAQTNITSFLSVRYAVPPIGNLRFQAPQPPEYQSGIQPATQNPNMCYQSQAGLNMTGPVSPYGNNKRQSTMPAASEDCLFLNVFSPGTMSTTPVTTGGLPVLVWIHGGGYQAGYAAMYNGADLLKDSLNTMVVVVVQYRLGAFGFLAGNEMKAYGSPNAGILDQNFALQWVQEYIGLFGGDKTHVTIWGESAGAGSVLQHIVAHGGNTQPPLFHAAMVSSTFLPSQYYYNDRLPQLLYNEVVDMTGCTSSANTFTCLQSVEADKLQAINYALSSSAFYGTFVFVPVVDGTFIVERPTITLARGVVNGVRNDLQETSSQLTFQKQVLLAMSNQNEGNVFVDQVETLTTTDYVSQLFPDMTFAEVEAAATVYQGYGTAVEQANLIMGDSILVCPTYYLLRTFSGRSWKGLFAIPPGYHGQDTIYYFDSPGAPPPYNNQVFINAFSQSFISLARFYDVNTKFDPSNITPYWNKYDLGEAEMLFNRTEAGEPVVMPFTTDPAFYERCGFWSSVTSTTFQ